jgi:hypothetical protein
MYIYENSSKLATLDFQEWVRVADKNTEGFCDKYQLLETCIISRLHGKREREEAYLRKTNYFVRPANSPGTDVMVF